MAGVRVVEYRFYSLGGEGHFAEVQEILAKDDEPALAQARAMNKIVRCEFGSAAGRSWFSTPRKAGLSL